jgi:hypothetical protein
VANAMEAAWKRVQQEATDELVRFQAQDAATPAAIVFVGEGDFIVGDGDEPGIGDGRAMRVAGEIDQHALGSAERRLGVDDEVALPQGAHALGEDERTGKSGQIPEEAEFAGMGGGFQAVEEQPAEGRDSARADRKKFGLQAIQRLPSRATPPPATRQ